MRNIFCLGLILLVTQGCGEFAYKRGASAKDLEATKKTCQSAGNESAIEKCLEDNGWVVQKLDALGLPDSELFATASVSPDNRNPAQSTVEKEEISKLETTSNETLANSDSATKATETNDKVANKPVKKEASAAPTVNAFEKYKINSWWKMGGGRDALELSITACSEKLGDAHIPDRKTQTFTRAFAACMYENGWRGLREK
jgi:uncharacterized protein YceK